MDDRVSAGHDKTLKHCHYCRCEQMSRAHLARIATTQPLLNWDELAVSRVWRHLLRATREHRGHKSLHGGIFSSSVRFQRCPFCFIDILRIRRPGCCSVVAEWTKLVPRRTTWRTAA